MRKTNLLLAMTLAATLACQPPELTRAELLQYQQQVEGRMNAWMDDMNNGRREQVMTYYMESPNIQAYWPSGQIARGFEEQLRIVHDFFNAVRYMNIAVQQPATEVLAARVAITTFGHSTDLIYQDSRRVVWPGRGTLVWVRESDDDEWKIWVQHLSANLAN